MTKEALWTLLAERNPRFVTGPIAFKPETLRRFFDLAWEEAQKEANVDVNPFMADTLATMFGGKQK